MASFVATSKPNTKPSVKSADRSRNFREAKAAGRRDLTNYDEWGLVYDGFINLPVLVSNETSKKISKQIGRFHQLLETL